MAKIGTKHRGKLLTEGSSEIDPSFFQIKFKINNKVFKKSVDDLLTFDKENLDELSDRELDKALDQVSYWRFTFMAAASELEHKLNEIERDFRTWYAGVSEEARNQIYTKRKEIKKRDNIPNNWFGSITKQEIEDKILLHPEWGPKFNQYQAKMSDIRKNMNLLFSLRDTIQDRGGLLQTISRRRLELAKQRFNA